MKIFKNSSLVLAFIAYTWIVYKIGRNTEFNQLTWKYISRGAPIPVLKDEQEQAFVYRDVKRHPALTTKGDLATEHLNKIGN